YRADVTQLAAVPRGRRQRDAEQQVVGRGPVRIEGQQHAVLEQRRVDPDVELGLLLPLEVRIGHGGRRRERREFSAPERVPPGAQPGQRLVRAHRLVADCPIAHAQLYVVEQRLVLHEGLVPEPPGERGGGEQRPLVI